jgi:hypothetical protein
MLEEDIGLEKCDLDVYKSFVKEHLVKVSLCFHG